MKYSRENPSHRHLQLINFYKSMHQDGYKIENNGAHEQVPSDQAFPGRQLPQFAQPIKQMIDKHNARSILDYGAGKGNQYQNQGVEVEGKSYPSVQEYWGIHDIVCYDPGRPGYDTLPQDKKDGVVSTDVMEHCSHLDIPWIVKEMFSKANKFVFVNIACYPALAKLPNGENAHCTIRPPAWWNGIFTAIANDFGDVDFLLCCAIPENGVIHQRSKEHVLKHLWIFREK